MICKDFQPFSVVEDDGFKNFIKLLDPRYNLPSRTTLRDNLLKITIMRLKINCSYYWIKYPMLV